MQEVSTRAAFGSTQATHQGHMVGLGLCKSLQEPVQGLQMAHLPDNRHSADAFFGRGFSFAWLLGGLSDYSGSPWGIQRPSVLPEAALSCSRARPGARQCCSTCCLACLIRLACRARSAGPAAAAVTSLAAMRALREVLGLLLRPGLLLLLLLLLQLSLLQVEGAQDVKLHQRRDSQLGAPAPKRRMQALQRSGRTIAADPANASNLPAGLAFCTGITGSRRWPVTCWRSKPPTTTHHVQLRIESPEKWGAALHVCHRLAGWPLGRVTCHGDWWSALAR